MPWDEGSRRRNRAGSAPLCLTSIRSQPVCFSKPGCFSGPCSDPADRTLPQPCAGGGFITVPAERLVPLGAFRRLQKGPVHRHSGRFAPILPDHSQLTTSLLPNARWEELLSEPDHGYPHCSRRHRRPCRCSDHCGFCDHVQRAAQPAVGQLSRRNQQSPDAIMNGAVLDPDNVCPTCRSSAFELPAGSRAEAPVRCGHCHASLGSWTTFRRRVGRVLLLRPASGRVSRTSTPSAESRAQLWAS